MPVGSQGPGAGPRIRSIPFGRRICWSSLNHNPFAIYNGLLKRVHLDIPALIEFPLYPVPLLVSDLRGFRIVRRLAIPAHLLIRGDVVDLSRGISLIFLAARGTGSALGTFGFVARRTESVALIGFHCIKVRLKIAVILVRVPRGSGRPARSTGKTLLVSGSARGPLTV